MTAAFWQRLEARKPEARMALGLGRVRRALDAWGAPDRRLPAVLIAGTNGKGSTTAFLKRLLGDAGTRTGAFTSPHTFAPTERVRIVGREVEAAALVEVLAAAERQFADLTYFELFALAAWQCFVDAGVELALLEVGLGGRLDATNAAQHVVATAITSIGLDHTQILGGTLPAIAGEKAAIARAGVPLWHGPLPAAATAVVAAAATAVGAPRHTVAPPSWSWPGPAVLAQNAEVAAAVASGLLGRTVAAGPTLLHARPFGRWSTVSRNPLKIVDGAHNPDGAAAAAAAVPAAFAAPPEVWLLCGRSKDVGGVVAALAPVAGAWVLVDGPAADWHAPVEVATHLPAGTPWRAVPMASAPDAFLDEPAPALWLGTLRGLGGFAARGRIAPDDSDPPQTETAHGQAPTARRPGPRLPSADAPR